jgi:hypothetical protein
MSSVVQHDAIIEIINGLVGGLILVFRNAQVILLGFCAIPGGSGCGGHLRCKEDRPTLCPPARGACRSEYLFSHYSEKNYFFSSLILTFFYVDYGVITHEGF